MISIAQNQVIISILELINKNFNSENLKQLFLEKKRLKRQSSNSETIKHLLEIENKINDIIFIPEIISVVVNKSSQYDKIIKNKFKVNETTFVRLLCGAGHSRRNTAIFCSEEIEYQLKEKLNNGRKIEDMVLAKNNAYFALSYSGTLSVSEPYFCVVKDYEVKRKELVEFIDDHDNIEIINKEIDFNVFDGMGLISPALSKKWAEELQLDYIPSCFIIRHSFLKGMVCTFDFHKYSEEVGNHYITDAWGNKVNLRDMDLVLTTSQFKGWNFYNSLDDYIKNCRKNNFNFGIVRVSPKEDDTHIFTNYQFLQVLNLNNSQIENLCKKTIDYFSKITGNDIYYTLLYLLGKNCDKEQDDNFYDKIHDVITKILILNNSLINDPFIINHINHSLNKKIRESYLGNLIVDGNYSFIVQDPLAFTQYVLGLPVEGLLSKEEHYSNFWNKKSVNQIAGMRAPLTWRSEVNILNLKKNKDTEEWYKYLKVGTIIYNIHSNDMLLHADADSDGDLVMTTNQQEFINGSYGGLPINYEKKKVNKQPIIENDLWEIDKLSFDSRIGFITNSSTTLYAMLLEYEKDTLEYNEILRRLKLCRKQQGNQIDKAKGLTIDPFPKQWTSWIKIKEDMSEEKKLEAEFNNKLLINKRPYFFRYLYNNYSKKYSKYNRGYQNYTITTFGKSLEDILNYPISDKEIETKNNYLKYSPLLNNNCIMNLICRYMEQQIKFIKSRYNNIPDEKLIMLLKDKNIKFDEFKLNELYLLYKKYKSERRNFANIKNADGEQIWKTLQSYDKYIRQEAYKISSNISELANLAIDLCYIVYPSDSKTFVWGPFGEGILQNVLKNRQEKCFVPFLDKDGDIEYLGKNYSLKEINVEKENNIINEYYF